IIFQRQQFTPINTTKFKSKAGNLANSATFNLLKNAKQSFDSQDVIEGDVQTLGKLIDIIVLFYNPMFITLSKKFDNLEQFIEYMVSYLDTRNCLAHIASAKISDISSDKTIDLVIRILPEIPDKYFWFSSKLEIKRLISEFIDSLNSANQIKNNLGTVPKKHKEILMREKELQDMYRIVCGDGTFSRVAGSLELHGYGGVGKTTLALEFCYEVIRSEMNSKKNDYAFILWLSSKTEELTYHSKTGSIYKNNIIPMFEKCNDIIINLKKLFQKENMDDEPFFDYLLKERVKGIIVLDNLETIENDEKIKIKNLIKKLPREIQFIITSRNYESIAEENLQILGFSDLEVGKKFINEYQKTMGTNLEILERDIEQLIKDSFGNTLIMVLGLERIIVGTTSINDLIVELQLYKESEMEIIVDFMYKNTFDTVIREIENETAKISTKKLLTNMLLYGEPIDFHSLRELLNFEDSKILDYVLEKLVNKFVLNKIEGYYELQEFASKFVVLKMLPDQLQIKEMQGRISSYKKNIKENLRNLYEDKKVFSNLEPILDDWKPVTEADTIAISQAYSLYGETKRDLHKVRSSKQIENILLDLDDKFSKIEKRSYHPYIKFQKARILIMILQSDFYKKEDSTKLVEQIKNAYEETYFAINLKNKYLINMESYAAFLWLYGISLSDFGDFEEATKILEEAVERFSALKNIRNLLNSAKAHCLLARNYAILFQRIKDTRYLSKITASINESIRIYKEAGKPNEDAKQLQILRICIEVYSSRNNFLEIHKKIQDLKPYPRFLDPIIDKMYEELRKKRQNVPKRGITKNRHYV
ncbi:hypothetical protein, partial [Paenibacillus ferrarius]|uniref:hypothetical protein n=1 Tax=Paenibacillus ferrarius TaxID=1469647 RepID=UPI003D27D0EE